MNECDNKLKNDVLQRLFGKLTIEQLKEVGTAIDLTLAMYEVKEAETAIALRSAEGLELIKTYSASKLVEGQSKGTIRNKLYFLKDFFETVMLPPSEVKANDIRLYLFNYKEKHGCADSSLENVRKSINTFFEWCEEEGYIEKNPCKPIKKIKFEQAQRQSIDAMELERLRMEAVTPRDKMLIEFLVSTGCRIAEAVNVKIEDIDFNNNELIVHGKGKKSRKVYLNAKAHLAIKNYLETKKGDSPYLFCAQRRPYNQLGLTGARKRVESIAGKAGIELTPHILRHTCATMMLQNGASITSVQKVLGHSSINTTMIYAQVNGAQVKEDHRKSIN